MLTLPLFFLEGTLPNAKRSIAASGLLFCYLLCAIVRCQFSGGIIHLDIMFSYLHGFTGRCYLTLNVSDSEE